MPGTLKRSQVRELTLTRSSSNFLRSKLIPHEPFNDDGMHGDKRCEHPSNRAFRDTRRISRPRKPPRYTHPIQTVPSELLALIFIIGSSLDPITFPITVSHVCGAWRDVALRSPPLWRRLTLTSNTRYHLDMWRERIFRAKACSLDIEIGTGRDGRRPYMGANAVQWYMHLVFPTISRWRSLHISFAHSTPFLWNAALSGCCSNVSPYVHAPMIEDISLIYPANDDTKEFTLFGGVAPRLRSLTIDGIRLSWIPHMMCNLTFLDYTHRGPASGDHAVSIVLDMLEISSRLEELRISFPSRHSQNLRGFPTSERPHRRVALPRLTKLHLRIEGPGIPSELLMLLPLLSLPRLSSLHMHDPIRSSHPFIHLGSFLKAFRLPTQLHFMMMEGGWVDHRILPSLLRSLKNLGRLVVCGARIPSPYYLGRAFAISRRAGDVIVDRRDVIY
ncbi:hypothetical protein FIBSPDRAFT_847297 [Athelia psychrophila]|uniref:Uncharacterized protein n=1 Tax=Athelia psychrophila TaxID=1759441 RepID=A0A167VPD6_9AGAM|nr:hypothetical protein FIBSPDRAFT_877763 [Fibularhizoctonia sp. CBS 109695]KZP33393.1 hypothetical protein FIBSPDRAFT_847297 [Fibularhizoctonia sp. CBS 109695]